MKRIVVIVLVVATLICFCSCKQGDNAGGKAISSQAVGRDNITNSSKTTAQKEVEPDYSSLSVEERIAGFSDTATGCKDYEPYSYEMTVEEAKDKYVALSKRFFVKSCLLFHARISHLAI